MRTHRSVVFSIDDGLWKRFKVLVVAGFIEACVEDPGLLDRLGEKMAE